MLSILKIYVYVRQRERVLLINIIQIIDDIKYYVISVDITTHDYNYFTNLPS